MEEYVWRTNHAGNGLHLCAKVARKVGIYNSRRQKGNNGIEGQAQGRQNLSTAKRHGKDFYLLG